MDRKIVALAFGLVLLMVGLSFAPAQLGHAGAVAAPAPVRSAAPTMVAVAAPHIVAHPIPATTFPRTVLIETFTGVWCIHCPNESQALYNIDLTTDRSVIDIAELHVCAFAPGQGPCLENYVPPDGTSTTRGTFYNVCGFPDVFIDGIHGVCGATDSTSQMQYEYDSDINNASAIPGNVSIAEAASVVGGNVSVDANITSGVTGTYNAVSYLLEYIGKKNVNNGYGPHDVAWIVRETLYNHPVSLTAGASTQIHPFGPILRTWNELNFSVVTFVQLNSTKVIQNANMVPVTTLTAGVLSNQSALFSGANATITVRVANSSTHIPLVGAAVSLSASLGVLTPTVGVTDATGNFTAVFTAPAVTYPTNIAISARATAVGYTGSVGSVSILVSPRVLSSVPTGVTVSPANQQVTLNWTVPPSGGAGVTYYIYRSTTSTGTFAAIGASSSTWFNDTGLTAGQTYWYEVRSHNASGYSDYSTAVAATSVTAVAQGLPFTTGWWIEVDGANFSSGSNASLGLYMPSGQFTYDCGPASYAFKASDAAGSVHVAGTPVTITAVFAPRYAALQGTVSPTDATVTLNGAAVAVVSGAFSQVLAAGTYSLVVAAAGYQTKTQSITLTPGNVTTVNVQLDQQPTSTSSLASSNGGLTSGEMIGIVGAAAAVLVLLVAFFAIRSSRSKRARSEGTDGAASDTPPGSSGPAP
jgi:hypothetical protein